MVRVRVRVRVRARVRVRVMLWEASELRPDGGSGLEGTPAA